MTVGQLRELIADLPDTFNVRPQWVPGSEPGDHEPGVKLHGFEVEGDELLARVELFYLDEIEDHPSDATDVWLQMEEER